LAEKEKPKKERDMVIMEGYKLAANGRKNNINYLVFTYSFIIFVNKNCEYEI